VIKRTGLKMATTRIVLEIVSEFKEMEISFQDNLDLSSHKTNKGIFKCIAEFLRICILKF